MSLRPAIPDAWDVSHILSQKHKVVIVTGANSGLGYETALQLALRGAHVVLACRNNAKGFEAETNMNEILNRTSDNGSVACMQLDVSDLTSVRKFAEKFKRTYNRLDILVNSAGVLGGSYALSVDGYERVFATNHLGHFALTAQLFDLLKQNESSRVVNVSSNLHKLLEAWYNEDEMMVTSEDEYGQWTTYGQTKLCNVLFTIEMDQRLQAADIQNVTVVACHPGFVATKLGSNMAAANTNWIYWLVLKVLTSLPGGKDLAMGAVPILYTATGNDVVGGDYIGPKNSGTGEPDCHESANVCKSESAGLKLWENSEKLVALKFDFEK